jgi:CHAT domain-containing protein
MELIETYLWEHFDKLYKEEKYKEAIDHTKPIIERCPKNGLGLRNYAFWVCQQGAAWYALQEYEKATECLIKSTKAYRGFLITVNKRLPRYQETLIELAKALHDLAMAYKDLHEYSNSEDCFKESLKLFIHIDSGMLSNELISTKQMLATLYEQWGDYRKALSLYKEVWELKDKLGSEGYFILLISFGNVYMYLRDYDTAGDYFQEGEAWHAQHEKVISRSNYGSLLLNYGLLWLNRSRDASNDMVQGQHDAKAKEYFRRSKKIAEDTFGGQSQSYADTLVNMAGALKESSEAIDCYEKALEVYRQHNNKRQIAVVSNNLASRYANLRETETARDLLKEVIESLKQLGLTHHYEYAHALFSMGSVHWRLAENNEALGFMAKAVKMYLNNYLRFSAFMTEKEQMDFYKGCIKQLRSFYAFLYQNSQSQRDDSLIGLLYNTWIQTKGLLLNSQQYVRREIRKISKGDANFQGLYEQWQQNSKKLWQTDKNSSTDINQLEQDLEEQERTLAQKALLVKPREPSFFGKITWQDIQESLKENDVAIEIICIYNSGEALEQDKAEHKVYIALLITKTCKQPELIYIGTEDEIGYESILYNNYKLAIKLKELNSESNQNIYEQAYQTYWQPIENRLPEKVDKIYLSLDGVYQHLNIHTFTKENKPLLDLNVQVLPNTRYLLGLNTQPLPKKNLSNQATLFGNPDYGVGKGLWNEDWKPLSGTQTEVDTIETILSDVGYTVSVFTEAKASKENFHRLNNTSNHILHIATHGYFGHQGQTSNPLLNSSLMLAEANNNAIEGVLSAYEISKMDLEEVELAVLSACGTALGENDYGEGVWGLQSAFLTAGVKNIIMSLWTVPDDTTRELMTSFYKYYLKDKFPAKEALIRAQKDLQKQKPAPYFWGAWILLQAG